MSVAEDSPVTVGIAGLPIGPFAAFERANGFGLAQSLVFLAEVGSTAHNTVVERPLAAGPRDSDWFGVVVAPPEQVLGLTRFDYWEAKVESGGDTPAIDVKIHSLDKFLRLVVRSNPDCLSALYLGAKPTLYMDGTVWPLVRAARHELVSRAAYHTFVNYAQNQLARMERGDVTRLGEKRKALVTQFGYDTYQAAHVLRLLATLRDFLQTGDLAVSRAEPEAEDLRAVKRGEWPLAAVREVAEELMEEARAAEERSSVRESPDTATATGLLVDCHLLAWRGRWERRR